MSPDPSTQAFNDRNTRQYNLCALAPFYEALSQILVGTRHLSLAHKPSLQITGTTSTKHLVSVDPPKGLKMLLPSLATGGVGKKGFARNAQLCPNKVKHFFWDNLTVR
jgi:hypothetical protein